MSPVSLFVLTYGAVLAVEVAGDRSLYTVASLTSRFRTAPVLIGVALAVTCKMAVAVLLGRAILLLPEWLVRVVSVATLLAAALAIWRGEEESGASATLSAARPSRPVLLAFSAVFLTEWADPGQLTAAVLSVRHGAPVLVWLAATLAVTTKCVIAATAGAVLRRRLPPHVLRGATLAALLCMAMLVALGVSA